MIKKLKMSVVHGKSLKLHIVADKETIQRLREGIKAIDHNIKEEISYKLRSSDEVKT